MKSMNSSIASSTEAPIKFIDEEFQVAPVIVKAPELEVKPTGEAEAKAEAPAFEITYTEDDLLFISQACWSIPQMIWPKLDDPDRDRVEQFNKQFYRYCRKKGIDPFEWFFDEFGLVVATIGVAAPMVRDYRAKYVDGKKAEKEEGEKKAEKGAEDYEHKKKVDEQAAKDMAEGKVKLGV